jgi:hypothetical protein
MSMPIINLNHNCLQVKIKTREAGVTMINNVGRGGERKVWK